MFEEDLGQVAYKRRSKAHVKGRKVARDYAECGCAEPFESVPGSTSRFEVVNNESRNEYYPVVYDTRPDYPPQPPFPQGDYGSKVYVNSAKNYCSNVSSATSNASPKYPFSGHSHTHANAHSHANNHSFSNGNETRIRLNAPKGGGAGGFSGPYLDARDVKGGFNRPHEVAGGFSGGYIDANSYNPHSNHSNNPSSHVSTHAHGSSVIRLG